MSATRIIKSYTAVVTMTDSTDIEFDVEVDYYDEDGFCIPEIDVSVTQQPQELNGMVEEYESEIEDALDTWFTKDCAQQKDGDTLYFTFDEAVSEVELFKTPEPVENPQPTIDKALEQIKQDIEAGDLTAIEELLKLSPISAVKGYLSED